MMGQMNDQIKQEVIKEAVKDLIIQEISPTIQLLEKSIGSVEETVEELNDDVIWNRT